jgi:hypothetical protein
MSSNGRFYVRLLPGHKQAKAKQSKENETQKEKPKPDKKRQGQ